MAETRLIDANAAAKNTDKEIYWTESEAAAVRNFLAHQPTIDPESLRPTGRWAKRQTNVGEETYCTACGEEAEIIQDGGGCELLSDYCPNCGAEMEG